jgi:SAM-dependent methyltransferase
LNDSRRIIYNWLWKSALVKHLVAQSKRRPDICILDEGILHALWSACLRGTRPLNQETILASCPAASFTWLLVRVDCESGILRQRLVARAERTNYRPRLLQDWKEGKNADLPRQLSAISDISEAIREHWEMGEVRTMRVSNDKESATDEVAEHVAGWILKNCEPSKSYRTSHASTDYGQRYRRTYERGYYRYQWEQIEKPILDRLFDEQWSRGARSILDFACGGGRILSIGEQCFEMSCGVDVSGSMLIEARRVCHKSDLVLQDITTKPLGSTFDVVTAFRFFLNAEPELRKEALQAIRQALNPGGVLIANVHVNSRSILGCVYRLRNTLFGRTIANTLSYRTFEETLRANGFRIEKTVWYSFLPRTGSGLDRLAAFMMKPFEKAWKATRLPEELAQCFICVCRKTGE